MNYSQLVRTTTTEPMLTLAEVERQIIEEGLKRMGAVPLAKVLGVGKSTIYRKIKAYELDLPVDRKPGKCGLRKLLKSAREASDFLSRCVGRTAPALGKSLSEALAPFEG